MTVRIPAKESDMVLKRQLSTRSSLAENTAISARHRLLGQSWTMDVDYLESAIRDFKTDGHTVNGCDVVFFELQGDAQLHCNVTHRHPTRTASGWAGPGEVAGGFVYNRRFADGPKNDMLRH